jgi:hypothetical protein
VRALVSRIGNLGFFVGSVASIGYGRGGQAAPAGRSDFVRGVDKVGRGAAGRCRVAGRREAGFRPDQKQAFGGARAGWGQFLGKLHALLVHLD